jgi:hypothetical protein
MTKEGDQIKEAKHMFPKYYRLMTKEDDRLIRYPRLNPIAIKGLNGLDNN